MNRSESKYFNTASIMDEALIQLLNQKDFSFITVKELCKKAGVNRSTFYLHYESMNDLLGETLASVNKEFMECFQSPPKDIRKRIENAPLSDLVLINEEFLNPYLNYIRDHKAVFKASVKNPIAMETKEKKRDIIVQILYPIFARFDIPEAESDYWIAYYLAGTLAIIDEWLTKDCKDDIEVIEKIIVHCVRPGNALQNKKYEKD